ncbi:hypothetical protein P12x_003914 [Tundrisphaera lichenicola]|uniref:hypothetical protein n=1 Tax=Tundrisphaera lichenicola TaxID=2029860 RepID=UPI003EC106E4
MDASDDYSHLGRSRDVVSLTWAGRRFRRDGKLKESLKAYRSALALAARTSLVKLDDPMFDEGNQVRRYQLPREALMGSVVLDMIRSGDWTPEEWIEALPESAAGPLFASHALQRLKKLGESDRLLELAIERAEAPLPVGLDPAEHRAAVAEALVNRGRWGEAAEQYQLAIQKTTDDPTRRRWLINLAEVSQRMNDLNARSRALEAAKAPGSLDEISRRAIRLQQGAAGLVSRGDRP